MTDDALFLHLAELLTALPDMRASLDASDAEKARLDLKLRNAHLRLADAIQSAYLANPARRIYSPEFILLHLRDVDFVEENLLQRLLAATRAHVVVTDDNRLIAATVTSLNAAP